MEFHNVSINGESEISHIIGNGKESENFSWSALLICEAILLIVIILVALGGNFLVLLALSLNKKLRSRLTNWFIVNLAVADLLVSVLVMPFSAVTAITGKWYFGKVFCRIWHVLDVSCCCASILSLSAISLDRYIGVTHPLTYVTIMVRKRRITVIITVWTFALLLGTCPAYVIWPDKNSVDPEWCLPNRTFGNVMTEAIGGFFVPSLIILLVYWKIYLVAKRHEDLLARNHNKALKGTGLQKHIGGGRAQNTESVSREQSELTTNNLNDTETVVKFRRQKKAAKTLAIVIGAFFICWLPFFTFHFLSGLSVDFEKRETILTIAVWLGYANSALNPFIYVATSQQFKLAFKKILTLKFTD